MTFVRLTTPVAAPLLDALHALNEAHEIELSPLTPERLTTLIEEAFLARADAAGDALLIAFDQNAAYDSPNFLWFKARYNRFVYIDRVVVSALRRGEGLAQALYENLFEIARSAGHERIVCEVNFDPPNLASDRFHDRLGFSEAGRARLSNGKGVRYLVKVL